MADPNSPSQSDALRLVALGAAAPQVYELRNSRVTIGTGAGNDLLLDEPTASRRHAALERRAGRWYVVDLGSTNGTYINGRRVTAPAPLERGDELRFANARFGLVAPGDDLSKVGAGSAKAAVRSRRRGPRLASVVVAALVFAVGGFALTAYLLRVERGGPAGGVAARSAATPPAAAVPSAAAAANAAAATPSAGGAAGAATPAAAGTEAAAERPPPAASASAPEAGAPGGAPASAAALQWLARLNYYRAMVRLPPVLEDPQLSEADALHARYLVKNYAEAIRNSTIGAEAHEENSTSPWYTEKGMRAAKSSDVSYWQEARQPLSQPVSEPVGDHAPPPGEMPWGSPAWSIDGWIGIPFHRLSLISPYLRRSGFGRYCEGSGCAAGLDTLSDRSQFPEHPVPFAQPLEFPPSGAIIGMRSLDAEWPDPLTACSGYTRPAGFPVTLEVGANVDAKLGAYRLTRDGKSSADSPVDVEACGFDASSYSNPDAVAQQRARDILHGFGAVVIIPRTPLEKGASYTISMTVNGWEYRWTFTTAP